MDVFRHQLSEIISYSPEAYYRTIELYNQALWPSHLPAFVAGVFIFLAMLRPPEKWGTSPVIILGLAWFLVAGLFHYQYYSSVKWIALIHAALFTIQSCALLLVGLTAKPLSLDNRKSASQYIALFLIDYGIFIHPFLTFMLNGLPHVEVFALHPTPTLIVTAGVLIHFRFSRALPLLIIPLVYATGETAVAWELKLYEVTAMLFAVLIAATAIFGRKLLGRLGR